MLAKGFDTEPALKAQGLNGILQMLAALIGAGDVLPCVPRKRVRYRRCAALQPGAGRAGDRRRQWWLFASPLTGSGLAVNRLQQLFVAAACAWPHAIRRLGAIRLRPDLSTGPTGHRRGQDAWRSPKTPTNCAVLRNPSNNTCCPR